MSEDINEMITTGPVGNLRGRIENNLKLSIPKSNNTTCGRIRSQPSTAPMMNDMNSQFSELPMMKNLMKSFDQESNEDDYFVSTPGSIMSTPSPLKRKRLYILQRCLTF